MTLNEFLAEHDRFFRKTQQHPNKVTLHPADAADLLLVLKPTEMIYDPHGRHVIAGTTIYQSAVQNVGRASFEIDSLNRR